jgi:yecA family protein
MAAVGLGPGGSEQPPGFANEKQAKRILSLLIGHTNVLAFTLTHGPQHHEPRFYAHKIEASSVPIVDEWCCGYVKGIALDPVGWQPLIDARPDWFEVIHLYGTKSGWNRLKELVDAHEDCVARHQAFVNRIAPAARNVHAYWLARRAPHLDSFGRFNFLTKRDRTRLHSSMPRVNTRTIPKPKREPSMPQILRCHDDAKGAALFP